MSNIEDSVKYNKAIKDAARYRFLRDNWFYCGESDADIRKALSPEELDSTVDSLIAKRSEG